MWFVKEKVRDKNTLLCRKKLVKQESNNSHLTEEQREIQLNL